MFDSFKPNRDRRKPRHPPNGPATPRRLQLECLEPRLMLEGDGLLLSNDAYLTLSFASDGVQIAGQANALATKFDAIASEDVWREAILRAFQTWAVRTNADVGVVSDGGQPFGTPGPTRGDTRFGDIRIGAVAMDPAIGAVSVPINRVVGGTWHADVVFNTHFDFSSVSDVFEIALHEAGHVFGLDDNSDPNSPLHGGTIPTATEPTAADTTNLQSLYGTRLPDVIERSTGGGAPVDNNSFAKATQVDLNRVIGGVEGSAPSLLYGDVTTTSDVDFYRLDTPSSYSGPVTFRVRSAGISLMAPHLQIFDAAHTLVQEVASASKAGDDLSITLPNLSGQDVTFYVEVSGVSADIYGSGGYALSASFDGINQLGTSSIANYSDSTLRKLTQDQLAKLLNPGGADFVNDDLHADDDLGSAATLESESDFSTPGRFDVVGSISDQHDSDFYRIRSPQAAAGQSNVLTVTVSSLAAGRLVPKLTAFDRDLNPVSVTILADGGGELVVQIAGIQADKNYYLEVAADDPNGPFDTGNYEVTASFGDQSANFQTFAAGTLAAGAGQNVHTLYVAQPQLFQFLLNSSPAAVTGPAAVLATIYDESNQAVYRLAAPLGETRSQGAVLLAPGTYTVSISLLTLGGSVNVPIDYELSGTVISDPFASDPNDQTTNPFSCPDPGSGSAFCYPGDIISNDPFLWNSFTQSLPNGPPAADLQTQISMLLGSWWSWFWAQTGVNGPPLAQPDVFTTPQDSPLSVPQSASVLSNDNEPEGSPMTAVLSAAPSSGTLLFNADGSFQYAPMPGFSGQVHFTYQASDFTQLSNVSNVTISVGLVGDYDHNGSVNQLDYNMWRASFGSSVSLAADGNGDGMVNAADYTLWRNSLGSGTQIAGDYDYNGTVDQLDYNVWRDTFGSTTNLAADGNGDKLVDAADYTVWRNNLSAPPPAAGSAAAGAAPTAASGAAFIAPPTASGPTQPVPAKFIGPASPTIAALHLTSAAAPTVLAVSTKNIVAAESNSALRLLLVPSEESSRPASRSLPTATASVHHKESPCPSATDAAFDELDAWLGNVRSGANHGLKELLAVARIGRSRGATIR